MSATDLATGAIAIAPDTRTVSRAHTGGIAMVLHDLRGGGAERACLRLAGGMVAAGRAVNLVLVKGEGVYLADVPGGVNLTVLDCPRVWRAIPALAAHFRRTRPQAVLSALTHMNVATLAAAALSGSGARVVVSERNQISAKAQDAKGMWNRALYRAAPLAYRAAHAVVAVSGGVAGDLARFARLGRDRIRVIHNPVFSDEVEMRAAQEPEHPWFLRDHPPIVLAVGRLHRQKGFDILIRAFAIARAQVDCRLVILGEGSERDALQRQTEQSGLSYDIDLAGFCANPFALMARAGAFVLSSRWEGFPNALIEAMACGAPVIATDCPSGPNEILYGDAAPLVPVDDAEALARALVATLRQRPDTNVTKARAREFSISAAADRYLQVLET
jgi:glycosyltransferase involved in cell wall biosynthesis